MVPFIVFLKNKTKIQRETGTSDPSKRSGAYGNGYNFMQDPVSSETARTRYYGINEAE